MHDEGKKCRSEPRARNTRDSRTDPTRPSAAPIRLYRAPSISLMSSLAARVVRGWFGLRLARTLTGARLLTSSVPTIPLDTEQINFFRRSLEKWFLQRPYARALDLPLDAPRHILLLRRLDRPSSFLGRTAPRRPGGNRTRRRFLRNRRSAHAGRRFFSATKLILPPPSLLHRLSFREVISGCSPRSARRCPPRIPPVCFSAKLRLARFDPASRCGLPSAARRF